MHAIALLLTSLWFPLSLSQRVAEADRVGKVGSCDGVALIHPNYTDCLAPRLEAKVRDIVARLPPWTRSASGFDVIAVPDKFTVERGKPVTIAFGYRNGTAAALVVPLLARGGVNYSVTANGVVVQEPRPDPPPPKRALEERNLSVRVDPGYTAMLPAGFPLTFAEPGCYSIVVTAHRLNGTGAAAAPFEITVSAPLAPPSASGSAP